jgi:hypothetical protein
MEDVGILDMAAATSYGTLLNCPPRSSMCVREENPMAMSLLFALLGVNDRQTLNVLAGQVPIPVDVARALKYVRADRRDQREVRAALYRALYAIIESGDANRDLTRAIGLALCNAITGNLQGSLQHDPDILRLFTALKPVVADAIDYI